MDIVVAYGEDEFIIELKIWRGNQYRKQGIAQLEQYMDSRTADKGYLLSFSFADNKEYRADWISGDETDRKIFEVVV
jgi:hypothetical protein